MTTGLTHAVAPRSPVAERATFRALARADARRYARHPLFLVPCAILVALIFANAIDRKGGGTNPLVDTMTIALFLGVFGLVVAHRLTTSLLRTRELVGTVPVERQERTASLCVACLVSAAAGLVAASYLLVANALWPPNGQPSSLPVTWFSDYPASDVLPALLAMGPVAALGGPLLGVAVARWAPFRGSALLGVVVLVVATAMMESDEPGGRERLVSAWPVLIDEHVDGNGNVVSTTFTSGIEPIWALGWVLCLCGLAVVAALLRDPGHRRRLLIAGGALTGAAAACFVLALS
ncbi:MAG TPA: hypothetical protein VFV89_19480 [Nocardioides sp.]|uniref:hypothetical protein n=1 Tax=Nocardioides sp. TaxID=35761 RepID=UPI002E3517E2|nr:hypothetical protein [Nocardioides sp.]HEX5089999.1 hypothetical protein [Nocardioides sp.]